MMTNKDRDEWIRKLIEEFDKGLSEMSEEELNSYFSKSTDSFVDAETLSKGEYIEWLLKICQKKKWLNSLKSTA